MPFQLSPGVTVVEKDFTSIVPAVATSAGAFAGTFQWGPIEDPVTITSENELVSRFGKPNGTQTVYTSFFTAANFLSYTNNLLVIRADGTNYKNAVATGTAVKIKNVDDYTANYAGGEGSVGTFAAKYPGTSGNSLKVGLCDAANYTGWAYEGSFDGAPGTSAYAASKGASGDEIHIIVIDEDGAFTGTPGTILEKFAYVSVASDAKKADGTNNYYKDVLNSQSRYVWWMDHPTQADDEDLAWGAAAASGTYHTLAAELADSLTGGVDDHAPSGTNIQNAYAIFNNAELYDISLIMLGKNNATNATYVINNVAESRLDCVVFVSPENTTSGDIITSADADPIGDLTDYRDALPSSSYAVIDSGYKYQYDRYNDVYRYVPLNGDIAGLCARTDYSTDPWFSPGGFNRGQIKNVVKLAVNPNKTQRDTLYKKGVNPVVTFPGQGTVLFGDKTALSAPSAFDRINVRRLFIVLEKAISTAAKFQLFEFNDAFTRAQFKNLVEPFLRDVQGRRGITDFAVVCDETNNTGEVIDRNEFACDIYIKPNRSINFITLTFVAARSSVNFSEIGG
jgi:phage tail sheath protein FI